MKVERTGCFGARVVLQGDTLDEARAHALELAVRDGLVFVHPYDDEAVVADQGTAALEMLEDVPKLDMLLVSVGGGGLMAGMAVAAKALRSDLHMIGVQTIRSPSMYNAVKHLSLPQGVSTIAEGIAVGSPGKVTQAIIERLVDDILLVDEGDIEQAIVMLLGIEKTLTEGAGAAPLAAILRNRPAFAAKEVGIVLSGGNIDPVLLESIIHRGLVREGRLARFKVCTRDVPGALATISALVSAAGANIDEVHHQRAFSSLAAQNVEIQLVLQTRDREHIGAVLTALREGGFEATLD